MWTEVPVLDALDETRFFSLFLGLILNVVIVILLGLSVLLIYSLLMVNVETRTFELGVMRLVNPSRPLSLAETYLFNHRWAQHERDWCNCC